MPRKMEPKKTPIRIRTSRALRASGGRNAGTPFDTASVPVSATEPAENARRIRSSPSAFRPLLLEPPGGGV